MAFAAFLVTSPVAFAQELPAALGQAAAIEFGHWTDQQLDGWIEEGEDFLAQATDFAARAAVLEALIDWNAWRNEKTPEPTLAVLKRYFEEVPDSPRHDEFDWLRVRLEDFYWEHEGNARLAIHLARTYERYLARRPDTDVANEIRLSIGWEYLVAYEPQQPPAYSDAAARSFRTRGRLLLHVAETEARRLGQTEVAEQARDLLDRERVHILSSR
ncbi:MAG: hypothetical protein GKS06_01470 [Acidobacteria bacterium]|nr:hypothetical protein [Acidobacteriota bacterium]